MWEGEWDCESKMGTLEAKLIEITSTAEIFISEPLSNEGDQG
jgi:hypothetical protein